MAFDVNKFKSEVTNKGLMRTHNFDIVMVPPANVPNPLSVKEITFKTETVQAPGISFLKSDNIKHYGIGPIYNKPYNVVQTDITCTHLVERDGKTLKFFEQWMNYIVKFRRPNGVMDNTSYTMNYHDDYTTEMWIWMYDHEGTLVKNIKLLEVYPTSIEPISMGWAQTDELMKLSVSYNFVDWQYL